MDTGEEQLARAVAARFAALGENVRAVAIGGSRGAGCAEAGSDIDLYVYAEIEPALQARAAIAHEFAGTDGGGRIELDNRFWEPGDEWVARDGGGVVVDIMYRTPTWIEDQLARVLHRHVASLGYSTCFWWNVRQSVPLFDRDGWFARLQARAASPYPEELRTAIIARNRTVLNRKLASYRDQAARAAWRNDRVAVNHRVAAFLASYFDILFAIHRVPHPGEKRLVEHARRLCSPLPEAFEEIPHLLELCPSGADAELHAVMDTLTRGLDRSIEGTGAA